MSVFKRGKTWSYHLRIKDPVSGTQKRITKGGFRTKKDAEHAHNKIKYEVQNGTYLEPSKILYRDFFNGWLESKKDNLSRATIINYQSYLKNHIDPFIGKVHLSKISPLLIQKFINELRDKGLSSGTIRRIFNVINTSLKYAEKMQMISKNPALVVERPKVKHKEMNVWDVLEVKQFLKIAKNSRYYIVFHLAIATGMRQGEILGLRWKDVDLEKGIIYVEQTLSHDGKEFKAGAKTESGIRSINIDPYTVKVLKSHKKMIIEEKIKLGDNYQDNDLVVCTSNGTILNPRNLTRIWKNLITKSGLTKIRFHDLRHTHASLMLKQGEHIKVVSERLGHSKTQTTLNVYSHVMPNMQEESAKRFGAMLFENKAI